MAKKRTGIQRAAPETALERAAEARRLYEKAARFNAARVAPNTLRAYQFDWKPFSAWCEGMGEKPLPIREPALILYLASDESGYTTGAVHVIDGGWST